jgi:hypothetical protein
MTVKDWRHMMNWFRIVVDDGHDGGTYGGCTTNTIEMIAEKAAKGTYIRLDNLFYNDRGVIKEWAEWEGRHKPTVMINPSRIVDIIQYKDDPRKLPPRVTNA